MSAYTYNDIMEQVISFDMMKLNYAYDMCVKEHQLNLMAIDNKLIQENGTEDDLYRLYTAEAEESGAKKKGILGKLIDTILKFFRSIKEFLFGKKEEAEEIPDNENITLPENPEDIQKDVDSLGSAIFQFISGKPESLKNYISQHKKGAAAATAAVAVTATGVVTRKKWIPMMQKCEEKLSNMWNKAKSFLDGSNKLTPEDEQILKDAMGEAHDCGSRINKSIGSIFKRGHKKVGYGDMDNIAGLTATLKKYKADIEQAMKSKHGSFGGLSSSNKKYDRIRELSNMTNRSDAEEKEYEKLLNKYGSGVVSHNDDTKVVSDLNSKIDALINYNKTIQDGSVKGKLSGDGMDKAIEEIKNKFKDIQDDFHDFMGKMGKSKKE